MSDGPNKNLAEALKRFAASKEGKKESLPMLSKQADYLSGWQEMSSECRAGASSLRKLNHDEKPYCSLFNNFNSQSTHAKPTDICRYLSNKKVLVVDRSSGCNVYIRLGCNCPLDLTKD